LKRLYAAVDRNYSGVRCAYATIRNVTILTALVTATLISGCGSKSDATAAAQKGNAPSRMRKGRPTPPSLPPRPRRRGQPGCRSRPSRFQILKSPRRIRGRSLLAEESVIIRPEIDGRIVGCKTSRKDRPSPPARGL